MTQDRKPDWEWWGNICDLTILEAVALSMEIDPKLINYRTHRKPYGEEVTKRDESPEFEKRLALALRNLDTLSARGRDDVDGLEDYWVEQAKFAGVALSWNWKIPPRMAALAKPEKPLAPTERNNLLIIIAASFKKLKINYQDRGVAVEIAKMTEEIGAAVSEDTIRRVLAKIPDALESRTK